MACIDEQEASCKGIQTLTMWMHERKCGLWSYLPSTRARYSASRIRNTSRSYASRTNLSCASLSLNSDLQHAVNTTNNKGHRNPYTDGTRPQKVFQCVGTAQTNLVFASCPRSSATAEISVGSSADGAELAAFRSGEGDRRGVSHFSQRFGLFPPFFGFNFTPLDAFFAGDMTNSPLGPRSREETVASARASQIATSTSVATPNADGTGALTCQRSHSFTIGSAVLT